MNFLWENKEWLFSGIGVMVLLAIYRIYKAIRNRNRIKRNLTIENVNPDIPNKSSRNTQNGESKAISLLKNTMPHEIIEAIDSLPLLQRRDAAKHYIGMTVSWRLPLSDISEEGCKPHFVSIYLSGRSETFSGTLVCFEVSREEYSGLGLLKKHDIIEVEGRINSVDSLSIFLSDAKINY